MSEHLPNPMPARDRAPQSPPAWQHPAPEPAAAVSPWWSRFSSGWRPELVGAGLALLTLGLGSALSYSAHVEASSVWAVPNGPSHGWLDIAAQTSGAGPTVIAIDPDGASAGLLRVGDVITSVNGTPVVSLPALRSSLSTRPVGTVVHLEVMRNGKSVPVNVTLGLPWLFGR